MLLDFAYPTKQQGFLFITVSCIAIALLLILWYFLNNYYKKTKLANAEQEIKVIEPNLESEEPLVVEDIPNEEIQEEVVEPETVIEEIQTEEIVEEKEENKELIVLPQIEPVILYKKSFLAKLILNKDLQSIYEELRDYIMSFKKVKSRLSFKYERFSIGRKDLVKMLVRGKKIYLYFALNPKEQESKYHLVDVSEKKIGSDLPSLLKVQSQRSIKYAKQLIDKMMVENQIELLNPNKIIRIDYKDLLRRRSIQKLLEDGLIKEYVMKNNFFNTRNSDYLTEEEIKAITPEEADRLVSDEHLKNVIKTKDLKREGRMEVVNIDELSKTFEDGDYIDVETLVDAGIVHKNTKCIKVLARGTLDKKLTVEADAFSKQAMKMIVYKGGEVIVIK